MNPKDIVVRYIEAARDGMSAVIGGDGKIVSVREYTDTLHAARAFFPEILSG